MEARILAVSAAAFVGVIAIGATLQGVVRGEDGTTEPGAAVSPTASLSVDEALASGTSSPAEAARDFDDDGHDDDGHEDDDGDSHSEDRDGHEDDDGDSHSEDRDGHEADDGDSHSGDRDGHDDDADDDSREQHDD
jgi:hypothetical protein